VDKAAQSNLAVRIHPGRSMLRLDSFTKRLRTFALLYFGAGAGRENSLDTVEGYLKNLSSGFLFAIFAPFAVNLPNPNLLSL
jgi:hypothetical protein